MKNGEELRLYSNVEVDVVEVDVVEVDVCGGRSSSDGTDGNLSPICCSATADASCRIFSDSSFETSESILNVSPERESTISPFSV